jgi:transposase
MKLRTITIDLAKTVFQACGVNEHMKPQFNTRLKREQLLDFMRQQEPTMVVPVIPVDKYYRRLDLDTMSVQP